jgi:uncharacterized protein (TIGR00369 family)
MRDIRGLGPRQSRTGARSVSGRPDRTPLAPARERVQEAASLIRRQEQEAYLDALNSLQDRLKLMRENMDQMTQMTPWARRLGFRVTRIETAHIWGVQPWSADFSGDPDTGVIHGGVITSFLDNLSGMACGAALEQFRAVATLDLRIDYMRPADPGRDIIGEAQCYHLTRTIAFTHAWAYHETRDKVIATASAAFAINKVRAPNSAGTF